MTSRGYAVDHVVIAVPELDVATARLDEQHGLTALEGGRHRGWGTANRIVPLGSCYLELVTVVDEAEAASSVFGRWVTDLLDGAEVMGWAARTPDIRADAARLGVEVVDGARTSRTGARLTWRLAGVERAAADPATPFLIEWGEGTSLPGAAPVEHRAGPDAHLVELVVRADAAALAHWLGADELPVASARPVPRGV